MLVIGWINLLLAYYAWPRTSSTKVKRKEIRDVSTFTAQHVRAATRLIKCERQWRHVALATAGPMLLANNMVAYPLRISNSVCLLRISNTCVMSVHNIQSRQKHNMLSLLHAACLKLLVFFFRFVKMYGFLTICYFLKVLHVVSVLKCKNIFVQRFFFKK